MSRRDQRSVKNRLLQAMTPDDFARLEPGFEPMTTELHQVLVEANTPVRRLFFPEKGFVSITTDGRNRLELGLVGNEGIVGMAVLLGDDQSPYDHFVQAPGDVFCINKAMMVSALDESPTLRRLMLRYVHTMLIQIAQTAFVNATYDVEARLIRWLLMCQDRMGGDELALTHEFLSMMLGVQRTSVTMSLQILENTGVIKARRGRIEIRDRDQMLVAADKGYGEPEAAYRRLIGT